MSTSADDHSVCSMCTEPISAAEATEAMLVMGQPGGLFAHRECLLRAVLGGIGHIENHSYWCHEMHDPDGGRTYRQSALEVDAWVHTHGTLSSTGPAGSTPG